jgi:hypothetical protein
MMWAGRNRTTPTTHVTIRPLGHPALALSLGVAPPPVTSGGTLRLRFCTVRGTHVRITLQVVTTKTTLLGKGTKRTRVVHAIVLYQQGLRMPIGMSRGACGSATSRPGRCRHVLL